MKQKIGAERIVAYVTLLIGVNFYHKAYPVSNMNDEIRFEAS